MTDFELSYGVDALESTRGDAAPTPMPRRESPKLLEDLPLPCGARGCGSRAPGQKVLVRRGPKKGKKVRAKITILIDTWKY